MNEQKTMFDPMAQAATRDPPPNPRSDNVARARRGQILEMGETDVETTDGLLVVITRTGRRLRWLKSSSKDLYDLVGDTEVKR